MASERAEMESQTAMQDEATLLEQIRRERASALERQAKLNRAEEKRKQAQAAHDATERIASVELQDPLLYTLGGRGTAAPETPFRTAVL